MMNVPPPEVWRLWIGEIVLGTGERWINPTIHRTFTPAAPIRLYAVVASRSHVVEATVEIADASDGVMHTTHMNLDMRTLEILPPPNDPRTGRPAPVPVRRKPAPPPPTLWGGAIDMMLPLSRLEAGRYTVSIRVTSGENVASATVDFSVALGLGLALGA
jgi:hypothetical protein